VLEDVQECKKRLGEIKTRLAGFGEGVFDSDREKRGSAGLGRCIFDGREKREGSLMAVGEGEG